MRDVVKRFSSGTPYLTFPKKIFDEFFSDAQETEVEVYFEKGKIVIEKVNNGGGER